MADVRRVFGLSDPSPESVHLRSIPISNGCCKNHSVDDSALHQTTRSIRVAPFCLLPNSVISIMRPRHDAAC
jgi:hypothetical protein